MTEPQGRPVGVLNAGMSLPAKSTALALNTCSAASGVKQLESECIQTRGIPSPRLPSRRKH